MTRAQFVNWAASLLTGLTMAVVILVLGGPVWAAVSLGFLGFWVQRLADRFR